MQIANAELAKEPIGAKWYCWSGELRLVIHEPLGPVQAFWRMYCWALERDIHYLIGPYLMASQRGFETDSMTYFTEARKFLAKMGTPPQILDEMNL